MRALHQAALGSAQVLRSTLRPLHRAAALGPRHYRAPTVKVQATLETMVTQGYGTVTQDAGYASEGMAPQGIKPGDDDRQRFQLVGGVDGVEWVVWCGVVWCGVVWCGVVWWWYVAPPELYVLPFP